MANSSMPNVSNSTKGRLFEIAKFVAGECFGVKEAFE